MQVGQERVVNVAEGVEKSGPNYRGAAWCSAVGAVLSGLYFAIVVVVHASTYFGVDPSTWFPVVWSLHPSIFILAVPLLVSHRMGKIPKEQWDKFAPRVLSLLWKMLFAYIFLFVVLGSFFDEGGSPHERDGKYVLQEGSRTIRELTEEEYIQKRAEVIWSFSAFWMAFSAMFLSTQISDFRFLWRYAIQKKRELGASAGD